MRRLREGRRGGLMLDTMNGRRMGGRAALLGMVIFVEWHRRMRLRKYDSTFGKQARRRKAMSRALEFGVLRLYTL
jgi:hypothetical protein